MQDATVVSPALYQMVALKHGIRLYLKSGMLPNRAWTVSGMRQTVGAILGKSYPRSRKGLEQALADLTAHLDSQTTCRMIFVA